MNIESIVNAIKHILINDIECQYMSVFSKDARLNEDLYIDSVILMQVLIHLELSHDIDVPESAISQEDVQTVGSLARFLINQQQVDNASAEDDVLETPFEDIKVHCFVSCLCECIKASSAVDHRPFYFGVWDADVAITSANALAYHDECISHDFFIKWYKALYGVQLTSWYDKAKSKADNVKTLEMQLDTASPTQNVMVMLDMYLLPERENKFNQNPFPHYVMLKKTQDASRWLMLDPDFRWEGEIAREDIINAISSKHVEGGYVFDSNDIKPSSLTQVAEYFNTAFYADRNVLTDAIRHIVLAHRDDAKSPPSLLGDALKQIPVLAIRKYAYEHGFAYFWRDIGFPEVTFEMWCDEIENLVSTYKTIQYRCLKLAELAKDNMDTSDLFTEVLALLDKQDMTEQKIKQKLHSVFLQWLAFHQLDNACTEKALLETAI
ncbi:hypothetical protein KUC3_19800 [Alteromonas sp. KC3]|uniref:DUF6005 family protein n=1 Tax=unclassified Alteromonas TaxID=2614992 RepID=UPI0019231894|nr:MULTISPECIES: DUF6005 family protein [unclassified Alteromonas]BCO19123.1 hypothetical protein KUC3_19800 [Alteromonas sp. KC3]BCO23082.1 hypothetical protein KUC14_19510 [Alteromonas sp. KC14]